MGSYVFRWPYPASDVHVTGTFDDWGKSEQLNKVGDIWEKEVDLPSADEKVLYKFVVDDQWIVDEKAPKEGDGHNNVNNVLYPQDIKRREVTASAPGAFPETPSAEQAFNVNPIPASSGITNPISLTPGEPIPADVNKNTVDSTVTTSKEDYEKSGSSALPAALGVGTAAAAIGGLAGATAFKKPEGKESIIPESSLPMGVGNLETLDAGPFISSSGPGTTTADLASKVPLEKSVDPTISSAAAGSTTADLASKVPLEKSRDPTISSAAPGTSAAALAANVPLEQKRQGMIVDPKDVATTAVPETVQESLGKAHQDPEAAASAEAVKEKSAVEKELLSKVKESEATGQPASTAVNQTSYHGLATSVPKTVEESMTKANAAPEAAADPSIVAEKTQLEQELLKKTPTSNESGQPAPTLAAATTATAPTTTGAAVTSLTDGKTANEAIPDTDTSTATRGKTAGEIAGGGAVGGAAAAVVATATKQHQDGNAEPPRVGDAQKPNITTESTPANAKVVAPTTDVAADRTLADEPAVKMMNQNDTASKAAATKASGTTVDAVKPATVTAAASGVPTVTDVGTGTGTAIKPTVDTSSTPATPAKKTTESPVVSPASTTGTDKSKKKHKHRLSTIIKNIFHKSPETKS